MFKKLFLLMNILVITNVMGDEDEIEIQRTLPMTLNGNSLSLEGSASRDFCYLSIEAYHPKTKKRKATYGSLVANYNDELETMDLEELRVSNLCQGNGLGTILFNNACENLKSLEHTKMTWKASP
ncbi:MAG TPA: hypothetical protein QGF02_02555, partial [Candidatus Babeliales bacterium]|nr:hypothetical protein [Candidatus Babeliales bacterium]